MQLPELKPENHEQIYGFFADFEPDPRVYNMGFAAMHAAFGAEVTYESGAEAEIEQHIAQGRSVILSPNHRSYSDTPTVAGLVYEHALSPIKGRTIIPAKAEMFEWPVVKNLWPHMGAHPTFRSKDYEDHSEPDALRRAVREQVIGLNIQHIDDIAFIQHNHPTIQRPTGQYIPSGGHVAIFPEGERNKDEPEEVQPLTRGIGRIATEVARPEDVLILPIGIAYEKERFGGKLKTKPHVAIAAPISPVDMSVDEVLDVTHKRMQDATDRAFDLAA